MTPIVEVRYIGGDWADLIADMRSWLDRRQIDTEEFDYSLLGRGIAFRVGFRSENQAAAFAEAFGGRLQSANARGAAEQWRMPRTASGDADPSISTPKHLALLDDPESDAVSPERRADYGAAIGWFADRKLCPETDGEKAIVLAQSSGGIKGIAGLYRSATTSAEKSGSEKTRR